MRRISKDVRDIISSLSPVLPPQTPDTPTKGVTEKTREEKKGFNHRALFSSSLPFEASPSSIKVVSRIFGFLNLAGSTSTA
jgi:hypothetical protein